MIFNGKIVYNPSGKAAEYSKWAANFYNGCSGRCAYCYLRTGPFAKIMGGDTPKIKKILTNEENALAVFKSEVLENVEELRKHGLFLNFVSDPCLKETIKLNFAAVNFCNENLINTYILTKQTWWAIDYPFNLPFNCAIGHTLTGFDDLEPGCGSNESRINSIKLFKSYGFKTWVSFEPIIDFKVTFELIRRVHKYCDLLKIGLKSFTYHKPELLREFIEAVLLEVDAPVYFKDSLLQQAGITRTERGLPENFITRDFNLFENN